MRHLSTTLFLAAALFAYCGAAAQARPCQVYVDDFVGLPDGKTYAVSLSSYDEFVGGVRLVVWTRANRYTVDLPRVVSDQPVYEKTPFGYRILKGIKAPTQFFALSAASDVLALRALPIGFERCSGPLAIAHAYDHPGRRLDPTWLAQIRAREGSMRQEGSRADKTVTPVTLEASNPETTCTNVFLGARIINATQPEYPEIARAQGDVGTVLVAVAFSNTGEIERVYLYQSSGSAALDEATLNAARTSTYAPETLLCENQPGEFIFRADFVAA